MTSIRAYMNRDIVCMIATLTLSPSIYDDFRFENIIEENCNSFIYWLDVIVDVDVFVLVVAFVSMVVIIVEEFSKEMFP